MSSVSSYIVWTLVNIREACKYLIKSANAKVSRLKTFAYASHTNKRTQTFIFIMNKMQKICNFR